MKKSGKKTAITGLAIGCITVCATGIVAMANGNAYEKYKEAMITTAKIENMTVSSEFKVTQNGTQIVTGSQIIEMDQQQTYSSGTITAAEKTIATEFYYQDDQIICRVDNEYKTMAVPTSSRSGKRDISNSPNSMKLMEMVTDLIVGNAKNQFTGSGDHISMNLEGAQIPEIVNVAVAAISERTENRPHNSEFTEYLNVEDVENLKVQRISVEADLENNQIAGQDVTIVLKGFDKDGEVQELELSYQLNYSKIGETSPAGIDITGKDVAVLEQWQRN